MRYEVTAALKGCATAAIVVVGVVVVVIGVAQPANVAQPFRAAAGAGTQPAGLGRIDFPTSGSAEARPHFVRGVAALHNFEYDDAVAAFRRARQIDPGFAMACWGEALAHHSTLAGSSDAAGARAVLRRLAPSRETRLARVRTERERGFLAAVEALFGEGDDADRQRAYVAAMERLHARFPDDNEAASFYALALLDTAIRATYGLAASPADGHQHARLAGSDTQRTAGEILRGVLRRNPEHPGAAHYLLHAYDDPDHAAQALDVARTYARIAPASSHALHMPAHIFVQLGLWRDAAAADEAASRAADAVGTRTRLDEARRDYHPFTWLQYELLQLGRFRRARELLQMMEGAAGRTGASLLENYAASMRARYVVETRQWALLRDGDDFGNLDELVAIGLSAARGGSLERAGQVRELLSRIAEGQPPGSPASPALAVMQQEVAGLIHLATGGRDDAVAALRHAAEAELQLPTGMGPPRPIKPALELLGETLLEIGRPVEARAEFERALQRYPNRSASVLGVARAAAAAGDRALAARHYDAFLANWNGADQNLAEIAEARSAVAEKGTGTFFREWLGKKVTVPLIGAIAAALIIVVGRRRRGRRRDATASKTAARGTSSRKRSGR
jgi:tetratricopeptide (TPR) repeat protein